MDWGEAARSQAQCQEGQAVAGSLAADRASSSGDRDLCSLFVADTAAAAVYSAVVAER